MYDEEWWTKYLDWSKQTRNEHYDLAHMSQNRKYNNWVDGRRILLDIGCGRLHLATQLYDYDCYIGVDLNPEPFYKADVYKEKDLESVLEGIFQDNERYKKVIVAADYLNFPWDKINKKKEDELTVVSLFSTEMYIKNPNKIYELAFTKGRADKIIATGARYPGTDINVVFQEEGSNIYQTDPCCPTKENELWSEIRICKHVPSKMFGCNVVEVWRILERK